jgi:hypothetical protein
MNSKQRRMHERAQAILSGLRDSDWFSSIDQHRRFGFTQREFCGVIKHINAHGVDGYVLDIKPKVIGYGCLYRFVPGKVKVTVSEDARKTSAWKLLTSPIPMTYHEVMA